MDNTFKSPTILSMCTGMRGLDRGIERAIGELNTLAFVEIEAFLIENLVQQMEKGVLAPALIYSDLKTFPSEIFRGKVEGLLCSYPCQPFSNAGQRKGESDPRHLWPYIKQHIRNIRPVWCFFENVEGHLSLGYRTVRRELEELGYKVEEGIFSADEVGAPHKRKRLFILAIRKGVDLVDTGISDERDVCRESGEVSKKQRFTPNSSDIGVFQEDSDSKRCKESGRSAKSNGFKQTGESGVDQVNPTGWWARRIQEQIKAGKRYGFTGSGGIPEGKELAVGDGQRYVHIESKELSTKGGVDALSNASTGGKETGVGLADSCKQRCEECQWVGTFTEGEATQRPITECSITKWPARPGEEQYDWEAPRTVKSGMGVTINGYNFTDDLLRMAGNGVVEQTAERAFIVLLNKFCDE